ncbi:hypothetical protein FKM82_028154 [Ascaphus truei]
MRRHWGESSLPAAGHTGWNANTSLCSAAIDTLPSGYIDFPQLHTKCVLLDRGFFPSVPRVLPRRQRSAR